MALCDGAHRQLDRLADAEIQVGTLPEWTRVQGRAAWYVHAGPWRDLGPVWATFHQKVGIARPGIPNGPPGDVYACRPEDHASDGEARLLTILYVPLG